MVSRGIKENSNRQNKNLFQVVVSFYSALLIRRANSLNPQSTTGNSRAQEHCNRKIIEFHLLSVYFIRQTRGFLCYATFFSSSDFHGFEILQMDGLKNDALQNTEICKFNVQKDFNLLPDLFAYSLFSPMQMVYSFQIYFYLNISKRAALVLSIFNQWRAREKARANEKCQRQRRWKRHASYNYWNNKSKGNFLINLLAQFSRVLFRMTNSHKSLVCVNQMPPTVRQTAIQKAAGFVVQHSSN